MNGRQKFYLLLAIFQVFLGMIVFFSVNGIVSVARAQAEQATSLQYYDSTTAAFLALSSAISLGLSVLGAAFALKTVGTAAISSLSEKEEVFFKAFLVVALCEALAIYGLIIAVLLWTKIPLPP
ncbi:MAG: ATP synthase subunit C [Promethearchaeota archaeon]